VIFRNVLFLFCFLLVRPALAEPAVVIEWNSINKSLGITAKKTTLVQVLGEIRHKTGWEIVLEPSVNPAISIKTNPKPAAETLGLLLGSLRYTLKTQLGRPSRLSIYRNSLRAATIPIAEAPIKPTKLEGQIAVIVKNETAAKRLAKEFGAELIGFIKDVNAARFRFGSEQELKRIRDALAKADGVELVDDIFVYPRPASPMIARVGVLPISVNPVNVDTKGMLIIGLIDSAVQVDAMDKPKFILEQKFVGDAYDPGTDSPTHGTSMACIILRGLSNKDLGVENSPARILPVDIYGSNPTTTSFDVAHGITLAVEGGAKIVNLSLGSAAPSALVRRVIQAHHNKGVLFIGAAGNAPVTSNEYPAAYPEVMAVTAISPDGKLTDYANRGNFVDVAERGTQPVRFNNQTYSTTGTSGSTAYISGMAAALATQHRKKPHETREMIIKNRPFVPPKTDEK
jgi:hypothetical protein